MKPSNSIEWIEKIFSSIGALCQILGASLLVLIVGHYLLGGAATLYNFVSTGEIANVDARYKSPVYDNDPDKIAYWTEFNKAWSDHFEPYIHWRRNEFSGAFINVDNNGVRRTVKESPSKDSRKIFMFGGSTMWGTGSPDDKTIPSLVQAKLGARADVTNYGESAYVSTQELNALLLLLSQGEVPDAVVFYDGVNDGYAGAYSPAIPRDPHNLRLRDNIERPLALEALRRSNYKKLFQFFAGKGKFTAWDEKIAPSISQNSTGVVDMYEAHIKQVKALAKEYGFEAYFFWQPNLYSLTRGPMTEYEKQTIEGESLVMVSSQQAVYQKAKERFSHRENENIFFLGNVFDELDEPIYIDWHHVGPNGNEVIATVMTRAIELGGF